MVIMFLDVAVAAGTVCWLAFTRFPNQRYKHNLWTSAVAILGLLLAMKISEPSIIESAVSIASVAILTIASVAVCPPSNYIGLLHLLKCAKYVMNLLQLEANQVYIGGILVHLITAWMLFTPHVKQQFVLHLKKTFYVDGFTAIKNIQKDKIDLDDFSDSVDRQEYNALKKKFVWNPNESYSVLRAALRMAWLPLLKLHGIRIILDILSHMRALLLMNIIGTFISNGNTSHSSFWLLLAVWITSFIIEPASGYSGTSIMKLHSIIVGIIKEKMLEHYIMNKSDLNGYNFNINRILLQSNGYKMALHTIFSAVHFVCLQSVNISLIAYKIGWLTTIPIIGSVLLIVGRVYHKVLIPKVPKTDSGKANNIFTIKFNEFINNMHVIKQYAWESVLLKMFKSTTSTPEINLIAIIDELVIRVIRYMPSTLGALTVLLHVRQAHHLTYVELSTLLYETNLLMQFIPSIMNAKIEMDYCANFEKLVDGGAKLQNVKYISKEPSPDSSTNSIELNQCSFSWGTKMFALQPLSLNIKRGSFVTVVGRVGSGKSSLLSAMCGEMPLVEGNGCLYGSIGYVSQKPWIMNATFKDNILFGNTFDDKKYASTIQACALKDDIKQLAGGDMTEIGHKGINLSGGQKARLALARAIYNDADVYILDDVLSAVDTQVKDHLIKHVLAETGILNNKTRILVTHADHVVPLSDMNIIVDMGNVVVSNIKRDIAFESTCIVNNQAAINHTDVLNTDDIDQGAFNQNPELDVPQYNYWLIWKFIKLSGYCVVMLALGLQLAQVCIQYYQSKKLEQIQSGNVTYMDIHAVQSYVMFQIVTDVIIEELSIQFFTVKRNMWRLKAMHNMKKLLMTHLSHASITTYDRLPKATILGIYEDIDYYSWDLANDICKKAFSLFNAVSNLIPIISTSVYGLLAAIAPVYFLKRLNKWHDAVADEFNTKIVGKMTANTKKLMHDLAEGNAVVRLHKHHNVFLSKIAEMNANLFSAEFKHDTIYDINDIIIKFIEMVITSSILVYAKYLNGFICSTISPGLVKEWIQHTKKSYKAVNEITTTHDSLALSLPFLSKYFVYAETIEQEPLSVINDCQPPTAWPEQGVVEFKDYCLRYRSDLDLVLHNLTFSTLPQEKVGIVGRTGAGKSSLSLALLRLVEAASGSIFIDGVDISTIGLYDLRSRISMVPQDPMLLEGTIRNNLDPAGEYSDEELWAAISKAHIENLLSDDPDASGLDSKVEEGGSNYSVGERQLISLCRALLWKRNILILDEATANIDSTTDQLIQSIIRTEFKDCTVFTIAHRLNTVMDSDRIIVMDQGKIAEFDTPDNLLKQPNGMFSQMVGRME